MIYGGGQDIGHLTPMDGTRKSDGKAAPPPIRKNNMKKDTKVHITGLSKKGDELRALHLLRENKKTATHVNPTKEHPKPHFRGGPTKLPKLEGQAEAFNPTAHTRSGPYSFGDGDPGAKGGVRPGADDHASFKSLGTTGESQYHNRGHV